MGQQVFDIDTVGYGDSVLGNFYDFYVNNTFYLLAPDYYYSFYSIYLNRCLACYDGWVNGFHNKKSGLVPQRMLQSVATGLNNMLFAHGVDFNGDETDYNFAVAWAKKSRLHQALKKAHKYAIAGGTSLLKLNRSGKDLFATAHRIDTFFVDVDGAGNVVSAKTFYDAITNTVKSGEGKNHYGICEERYFNANGKPCVKTSVYRASDNLQTNIQSRPLSNRGKVEWSSLPKDVKDYIKQYHPSVIVDKEQYLPFKDSLGCFLMKFTDDIPQIPNLPFGQPLGDILFTENFQYDQMKYFEKNEVDLARARALIPETFWNKDDPDNDSRALNERFYQKVSSVNDDSDKITPIQFNLRGTDIRMQKENIYRDIAFKVNVSASTIATFLNEGSGAKTATEIVNERTKTDTWISSQISLNSPAINELLNYVMLYYGKGKVEVIFKAEDQSPYLDRIKINSDVFGAGNMTPRMFVKRTYSNLSLKEQEQEIKALEEQKALKQQMDMATMNAWQTQPQQ